MLTRKFASATAFVLIALLLGCATNAAQKARYFKAEHGVGATYVELTVDGRYKVIDREHAGVLLTDEGRWRQTGPVITFSSKDPKKKAYQAAETAYRGRVFLAITSDNAAAGIVITADDVKKSLDTDLNDLPDHVLFKVTAKTYTRETKESYPFHHIGNNP
jgi:hypothetical protein